MRNRFKALRLNEQGTTAVEFAIIAPVFIAMLVGTIALCVALFLVGSLHFAVEDAARCASVKTTICPDSATTITYAQNHYYGPNVSPTFNPPVDAACGKSMSASISYSMNVGFRTFVIPVSATACFPAPPPP